MYLIIAKCNFFYIPLAAKKDLIIYLLVSEESINTFGGEKCFISILSKKDNM